MFESRNKRRLPPRRKFYIVEWYLNDPDVTPKEAFLGVMRDPQTGSPVFFTSMDRAEITAQNLIYFEEQRHLHLEDYRTLPMRYQVTETDH